MFYVPDQEFAIFNDKPSTRIIKKFNELCSKFCQEPKKESKQRKRNKTLDIEIQKQKRISLPCKVKKSAVFLPSIEEKKFLLRGSEVSATPNKYSSSRKLAQDYQKKMRRFKNTDKLYFRTNKTKERTSIANVRSYFDPMKQKMEPWGFFEEEEGSRRFK